MSGALNMAVDDVLLDAARQGGGPILRTYGWHPPAVSIGYGQRADEAIDVERCQELGIDIVRRPTGGRAVLHWRELTYSFHCADGDGPAAHPLQEACRILGGCLVEGLRRAGVDATLARGTTPATGRRGACFASTSRWEVTVAGRKLVGSAQRRTRGALLQHGSILAGPEHLQLVGLLPVDARGSKPLAAASTHLAECAGAIEEECLARCLAAGFGEGLGLEVRPTALSAGERVQADILARDTYATAEHALRRVPAAGAPTA